MSCPGKPLPLMFIGKDITNKWVKNYQDSKLKLLNPSSHDLGVGDTKSLWYDIDKLKELIDEAITCQQAEGIRLYFAAYSEVPTLKNEAELIPDKCNKNLTAVFVFTKTDADGNQGDIFVEDDVDFPSRHQPTYKNNLNANMYDYDTGNPCPPNTCGGSLLPLP